MSKTLTKQARLVYYQDGQETTYSLEPGQLVAVFHILGLRSHAADNNYSAELEAQDPYFNQQMQAEIHRAIKSSDYIDFDPTQDPIEVLEARLNEN